MTNFSASLTDISLDLMEDLAREAGEIALNFFRNDPEVWTKGDNSPVSEADLAVDTFLKKTLLSNHPGFGWISEESASGPDRTSDGPIFIVDPIDGTRAFVKGEQNWAISIGVVKKSRPIAAVLYCPALDELYRAEKGGGAELNGETITVVDTKSAYGVKAAGPLPLLNDKEFFDLSLDMQPNVPSLAYRLALVADGRLGLSVAKGNCHDWDIAAADLLVHEAGGHLSGVDGNDLKYNEGTLVHPALVCASSAFQSDLCDRVAAITS